MADVSAAEEGSPHQKRQKTTAPEEQAPMKLDTDIDKQASLGISDLSGFSPELLKLYYSRLFPYREMCRWLSYGHDKNHPGTDTGFLSRREFSFTLENEIYIRYQSFKDAAEMEAALKDKCPFKVDIGAVYNVEPSKRTAYQSKSSERVFAPVEKELVFDVDMSDYDDIRSCCSGADICMRCWPLMTIAIKLVDTTLREDFGYEHLLWVFSGRRGVHCWVCDSRARRLNDEQRSAVADYFRVYKGNENNARKVSLSGAALHPFLTRSYEQVLLRYFEDEILPEQALLDTEDAWRRVLAMVPDDDVRQRMTEKWESDRRPASNENVSTVRWRQLEAVVKSAARKNTNLRRTLEEIVFCYTYPRLDLEVSKHMNHLLKAPFCIHPKTGKVCVPIDPSTCEKFDLTSVPSLSQLLNELNDAEGRGSANGSHGRDSDKTSLKPTLELFHQTFLDPLLLACKEELEAAHQERLREKAMAPNFTW